jgi:hypothetical protein
MHCPLFSQSARIFALVTIAACATPSFAALGDQVASIDNDAAHLRASRRIEDRGAYALHHLDTPTGTKVREFVAPAGTVFAVAWNGPAIPDLRQLLGTHFEQYQQAMRSSRRHGPVNLRIGDFIFQQSGHQRSFRGRAYRADLLPNGVTTTELQ